jgi:transposase-like protein
MNRGFRPPYSHGNLLHLKPFDLNFTFGIRTRYPLAYQHVSELLAERGVEVDPTCIWRWVQAYAPGINKRCRPHLKPTNKSYRTDV